MEYLLGLLVAVLGGLFYFKNKSDKAESEVRLGETKIKDAKLETEQVNVQEQVKAIDEGIERMKQERLAERERRKNMSLKELAEEIRKGIKS